MTYPEKLKDPRWQQKRLRILERDKFACTACGDGTVELHVHHRWYVSKRAPWEYPDIALETLCAICHDETHHAPQETHAEEKQWEACLGWAEVVFGSVDRAYGFLLDAATEMGCRGLTPSEAVAKTIQEYSQKGYMP